MAKVSTKTRDAEANAPPPCGYNLARYEPVSLPNDLRSNNEPVKALSCQFICAGSLLATAEIDEAM